jgi:hypothetical protein
MTWDIQYHSRELSNWAQPTPMEGQHGMDCAPAPSVHTITSWEHTVFQCRDHLMTAFHGGAYGMIYLTPNQLLDWSHGAAILRVDMSTQRGSPRDWIDIWLSPWEHHLALPLDDFLPDVQGTPLQALHTRMDNVNIGTTFRSTRIEGGLATQLAGNTWQAYETWLTPSASRRDAFELHVSRTHIKFGMPAYNRWWVDAALDPPLNYTSAVVQLGHHSYNPLKAECDTVCGPNTWHWDNILLSHTQPFTLIHSTPARDIRHWPANPAVPALFTLNTPAPTSAYLRFAAQTPDTTVYPLLLSTDGGFSWQTVAPRSSSRVVEGRMKNYFVPIPAGTTSVQLYSWGLPWIVKDLSVWSRGSWPSPTPSPLPVVTNSPSPLPSITLTTGTTSTPTPTRQVTATVTGTPTGSATPMPTTTATLVPSRTSTPLSTRAACSPRPPVQVSTSAHAGRLHVTITAGTSAALPNNALQIVRFGTATNARIDVRDGPTGLTGDFTQSPPSNTRTIEFNVSRQQVGASSTVPLVVVDACGEWSTFVGGGPDAF